MPILGLQLTEGRALELLFAVILPGWTFSTRRAHALPWPIRLRLVVLVAICDLLAVVRHGRPLRLLPQSRREVLLRNCADHRWRFLREGMQLARTCALLTAKRRRT